LATRSVIARPSDDGGWEGRYIQHDGYPEHHLPFLLAAQQYRFGADAAALACHLIDGHPAGWDILGADLAQAPGPLNDFLLAIGDPHSECFCHDWDAQPAPLITDDPQDDWDNLPWAYVLRPEGIEVISTQRDPQDLRGPVVTWSTHPQTVFTERQFLAWQPATAPAPRPVRHRAPSETAKATTAVLISRRTPRR